MYSKKQKTQASIITLNSFNTNHSSNEKHAILYSVVLPKENFNHIKKRSNECEDLLKTYGGKVGRTVVQNRRLHCVRTFVGLNKLEEMISDAVEINANLLLINASLSPQQIYNIEKILTEKKLEKTIKIWDREDLIIAIFSRHAKSATAKLQLQLASLEHFGPRIFGMGEDLSQQGGGIGTRGIGETNTEIMKRHIARQKKTIKAQLEKLSKTREGNRKRRKKLGFKSVSIIGYTNAGKSALFSVLAKKPDTLVKDELFATLDTKTSKIYLPNQNCCVLLSDTIGFIEDLPPRLMDAFRSTLEETMDTDLLMQVIDVSNPNFKLQMNAIERILQSLKVTSIPRIFVFNKVDALDKNDPIRQETTIASSFNSVYVSAHEKINLDTLRATIGNWLFSSGIKAKKKPMETLIL